MSGKASILVAQARSWIGCKESDGSHRKIIDVYNGHRPLARNYRVQYTDAWCATFVSACAIKTGMTDIIPTECGCGQMVQLFQALGEWDENDGRVPKAGDIIFYDWDDSGSGDNTGWPDHVGIVESVSGNNITVIEGNKNNAVGRRTLQVNEGISVGMVCRGMLRKAERVEADQNLAQVHPRILRQMHLDSVAFAKLRSGLARCRQIS